MTHGIAISSAQSVIGLLLLGGIWLGLPARWWPVDVFGSALGVGALSAAVLVHSSWLKALHWTRGVLWAELIAGTLTVSLLCLSLTQLVGSYGPVGGGGALLMATIAALILPYLVGLPALQLHWLRRR